MKKLVQLVLMLLFCVSFVLAQDDDFRYGSFVAYGGKIRGAISSHDGKNVILYGDFEGLGRLTGSALIQLADGTLVPLRVTGRVMKAIGDGAGGFYLVGEFDSLNGVSVGNFAHIKADGSLDLDLLPVFNGPVRAIAAHGKLIFAAGPFDHVGDFPCNGLVAISRVSGKLQTWAPKFALNPNEGKPMVLALAASRQGIFVAGSFDSVDGFQAKGFARFWPSLGLDRTNFFSVPDQYQITGLYADSFAVRVGVLTRDSNSRFGGYLLKYDFRAKNLLWQTKLNYGPSVIEFDRADLYTNSQHQVGFDVYNPKFAYATKISDLDGTISNWDPGVDGPVYGISVKNGIATLAGAFRRWRGETHEFFVRVSTLDGTLVPSPLKLNGYARAVVTTNEGATFVGGDFSGTAEWDRKYLAVVDTANNTLTNVQFNFNGSVTAVALDQSKVYALGVFTSPVRTGLAFDLNSGEVYRDFAMPSTDYASIDGAVVVGDRIIFGGSFYSLGGMPVPYMAAVDKTSGQKVEFGGGVNNVVTQITLDGERVIVTGLFSAAFSGGGWVARDKVAVFDKYGNLLY